jgi:hypothetical protein
MTLVLFIHAFAFDQIYEMGYLLLNFFPCYLGGINLI